jgi:enoyl-CoA hydratase/carnithine racemase
MDPSNVSTRREPVEVSDDVVLTWSPDRTTVTATLTRGHSANSLPQDAARAMAAAIATTHEALVVVIASEGVGAFCSGGDFGRIREQNRQPITEVERSVREVFQHLILTVRTHPGIVIGRLQGAAVGAGADLALACDMRVASTGAWIQEGWIRIGLVPALGGGFVLPTLLGTSWALEAILTARRIPAEECLRAGIFQRVVEPDELDAAVASLVDQVRAFDPAAVRAIKAMVRGPETEALREWLAAAAPVQAERVVDPAMAARLDAIAARHTSKAEQ